MKPAGAGIDQSGKFDCFTRNRCLAGLVQVVKIRPYKIEETSWFL